MNWILNNIASIVALITTLFLVVASWTKTNGRLDASEKVNESLSDRLDKAERRIQEHRENSLVHIDPHRDERMFNDFKAEMIRQFLEVNRKIDQLQTNYPPPPSNLR